MHMPFQPAGIGFIPLSEKLAASGHIPTIHRLYN